MWKYFARKTRRRALHSVGRIGMSIQSWYQSIMGKNKSKDVAKERLKLVLLHDRNDLSPQLVERLKNEIIQVLSKYVVIDQAAMDVEITRVTDVDDDVSAVIANIPILSVKDSSNLR